MSSAVKKWQIKERVNCECTEIKPKKFMTDAAEGNSLEG